MVQLHLVLKTTILLFQQFKSTHVLESDGCAARDRGQQLQMCFIELARTRTDVEINHPERFIKSYERHTQ